MKHGDVILKDDDIGIDTIFWQNSYHVKQFDCRHKNLRCVEYKKHKFNKNSVSFLMKLNNYLEKLNSDNSDNFRLFI